MAGGAGWWTGCRCVMVSGWRGDADKVMVSDGGVFGGGGGVAGGVQQGGRLTSCLNSHLPPRHPHPPGLGPGEWQGHPNPDGLP